MGGRIGLHFKSDTLSERENSIISYVSYIVLENCPFSIVTSKTYRRFNKYQCAVTVETIQETLLKLVELVELRIAKEMENTKGALLFDGWSKRGVHYVALIASYMKEISVRRGNIMSTDYEQRLSLIALSPMAKIPTSCEEQNCKIEEERNDNNDIDDEAVSFNAATHLEFMRDNLSFFKCDFDEWIICLISHNCSTNRKIAKDCGKPLVGCLNHKLNLQVNQMIRNMPELKKQIDSVHNTMAAARNGLKNAAVLRNLTELHPIVPNDTRWSGKSLMLSRYVTIRDDLLTASRNKNASLQIDSSSNFFTKVKNSQRMLSEINIVTQLLQTEGRTLSACRGDIEILLKEIEKSVDKPDRKLYNCKLTDEYLAVNSHLSTNPLFETAVVKLQEGQANQLTRGEKRAVKMLLKASTKPTSDVDDDDNDSSIAQQLAKRRKFDDNEKYICSDFIIGSAAEVERIWSSAKHILTDTRNRMKPLIFEAIIFLKKNERLWDDRLIAEAVRSAISDRTKKRIDELANQLEIEFNISD